MQPVDIRFYRNPLTLNNLVDKLKEQTIEYDKSVSADPRLFEFCLCFLDLAPIIVRCNPKLDKFNNKLSPRHFSPGWSVYTGNGLLKTLETYIIEDQVIQGLGMFAAYNGKRYSELPVHFQRKIRETSIDVVVDDTFHGTDNTSVIDFYCDVLNNLK